jgi:hypothetical protein
MEWAPASVDEVNKIMQEDLARCDDQQLAAFRQHSVKPYRAPILRYGTLGSVVVVARRGDEVIYWEDVEDGFNLAPIAEDGRVLEHCCNQDELGLALNAWIEDRSRFGKLGPAGPIE